MLFLFVLFCLPTVTAQTPLGICLCFVFYQVLTENSNFIFRLKGVLDFSCHLDSSNGNVALANLCRLDDIPVQGFTGINPCKIMFGDILYDSSVSDD